MALPCNDSHRKTSFGFVFIHFFLVLLSFLSSHSLYAQAPHSVTTSVTPTQDGALATTTVGGTAAAYHPSRVLVHFRAGIRDLLPGSGPARSFPGDADLFLVTNPPGLEVSEVVRRYQANPNVLYAEPDFVVHAIATDPNDDLWPQWDMTKIKAPEAWDLQTSVSSTSTFVAIIDTGIDGNHEDLQGNVYNVGGHPGFSCFGSCSSGGEDDYGHGTHVAGTIGAVGNNGTGMAGLNWNIQMISFKFLNSGGSGYISDAVLAFEKILELKNGGMNIRVTSNSWGGGGYSAALKKAMSDLEDVGTVHVCAAGNSGQNADVNPMYPAAYDNPGIISVLATDVNDVGASFTNYGLASVDIAAPGVSTWSTVPTISCALCAPTGYKTLSGTSMATPHVTGVLAAMIERRAFLLQPPLSAAEARDIILNPNSFDDSTDWMTNPRAQSTSTGRRLNFYEALTNPLLSSPSITLNGIPSLSVGPDIFTAPNTPVTLSATASDPDGDTLRGGWAKEGTSAGSTWLMGWWLNSLIPNPGNPPIISIPSFSLPMVSPFGVSYADNRGGGAYGRTVVTTSAGSAGTPVSESLSLSATDIAVGGTVVVTLPANGGSGTFARDVWAAGKGGASGWCCYTGSTVNITFNSAGVYRIGSQAMDSNLNLSNRPTAVVRVGGAAAETPLLNYTLDKTNGPVLLTVNIDMSTSIPPAGGSIPYYYFICGGGGFTPGSGSAKGSCTFTKPGAYWIMLQIQGNNGQVDIASAYVVATPVGGGGGDTTPPVLQLPSDITAEATGPSGAVVTYTATATDDVNGSVPVTCIPASGSTFGITVTTVNCSAADTAGNTATGSFKITVQDTTPPTVSITNPASGATVHGTTAFNANASDTVGVTKVEFHVDGVLKYTDTTPPSPYSYPSWDTTLVSNGSHTLLARAYDAALNNASAFISVTVSNIVVEPPTGVSATRVSSKQANVSWTASPTSGITGYVVERSTNGGSYTAIATLGTVTTYSDKSIKPGWKVRYRVIAVKGSVRSVPSSPSNQV